MRLVESDQGHSDQVIKEWCHAECSFCHTELDSASHVVVCHVKRKVGKIPNRLGLLLHSDKSLILLSQPFAMSSLLRRSASLQPTQNPQVWNDTAGQGGFLTGLMVRRNDNSVGRSERGLTLTKKFKHSRAQVEFLSSPAGEGKGNNSHKALSPYSLIALLAPRIAFTMAEILLSLTIIGVVAAITLPSLTGNINERTWNTQRKALYARMSQAVSLMPSLNSYGSYSTDYADGGLVVKQDTATETFLTAGLSKVLKMNNICDAEHIADCGISSNYTDFLGSLKTWSSNPTLTELNSKFAFAVGDGWNAEHQLIDTKAAAFETANGESVLTFYNPNCLAAESNVNMAQVYMCANFVYDLNGSKGPNTIGKDIGTMTVFYPYDSIVVAPQLAMHQLYQTYSKAKSMCGDDTRFTSKEEAMSIFYNQQLWGIQAGGIMSTKKYVNQYNVTIYDYINGVTGMIMNIAESAATGTGGTYFWYCIKR